nr:unnamed protein product [Spirometra erinaceieuropaei]
MKPLIIYHILTRQENGFREGIACSVAAFTTDGEFLYVDEISEENEQIVPDLNQPSVSPPKLGSLREDPGMDW